LQKDFYVKFSKKIFEYYFVEKKLYAIFNKNCDKALKKIGINFFKNNYKWKSLHDIKLKNQRNKKIWTKFTRQK
jgi:acyl-CoA-binding protein